MIDPKEILRVDLKEMKVDAPPLEKQWAPLLFQVGDRVRMTMQGLGGKELYLFEVERGWNK